MIVELFSPRVAKFQWLRRERLRRVETDVFFYEVAKERSGYMVGFGDNLPTRQTAIVGYYGFVYIDPATGDILRIERTARLPKDFPIRKSVTTLDYEFTRIAGQLYLLPFKAQTNLDSASIQTRNDVEFRNYRRFEADTKILFDKP